MLRCLNPGNRQGPAGAVHDFGNREQLKMKRSISLLAAAVALTAVACGDSRSTTGTDAALALGTAFASTPAGFSNTDNTFPASADESAGWIPDGHGPGHGGMDMRGLGFGGAMLGGGMHDLFMGAGFGPGFDRGFHGGLNLSGCTFGNNTFTCPAQTRNGVTVSRTVTLLDASGKPQSAYDTATTNTVTENVTVSGTFTRRDSATSTVQHASTRTVAGLAKGSTQRTINGTSAGSESTTGRDSAGTYTVNRTAGDTTKNVVIPVATGMMTPSYPTAGSIVRAMQVSVTRTGQSPTSASRREVITYDGSNAAKLVITENGTTKTCTLPLPFGRPTCQ